MAPPSRRLAGCSMAPDQASRIAQSKMTHVGAGYPVPFALFTAGFRLVTVCGPAGEHPSLVHGLAMSQVERLAAAALSEPNRHGAVRFLVAMLPEADSDLPGLRNSGLLATNQLRNGVPTRSDSAENPNEGLGAEGTGTAWVVRPRCSRRCPRRCCCSCRQGTSCSATCYSRSRRRPCWLRRGWR